MATDDKICMLRLVVDPCSMHMLGACAQTCQAIAACDMHLQDTGNSDREQQEPASTKQPIDLHQDVHIALAAAHANVDHTNTAPCKDLPATETLQVDYREQRCWLT